MYINIQVPFLFKEFMFYCLIELNLSHTSLWNTFLILWDCSIYRLGMIVAAAGIMQIKVMKCLSYSKYSSHLCFLTVVSVCCFPWTVQSVVVMTVVILHISSMLLYVLGEFTSHSVTTAPAWLPADQTVIWSVRFIPISNDECHTQFEGHNVTW